MRGSRPKSSVRLEVRRSPSKRPSTSGERDRSRFPLDARPGRRLTLRRMTKRTFDDVVALMARLRAPGGCPWDREQKLEDLKPFIIEEAYEVVDAIDRNDRDSLREELGDMLLEA